MNIKAGLLMDKPKWKREERGSMGLWGNDEAVKGNNCRCIFFPQSSREANIFDCFPKSMQMWAAMFESLCEEPERRHMNVNWLGHSFSQAGVILAKQEMCTQWRFGVDPVGSLLCRILVCVHRLVKRYNWEYGGEECNKINRTQTSSLGL